MAISDYQNTMGNYNSGMQNGLNQYNQNSMNSILGQLQQARTETKPERIERLKREIAAQSALLSRNQVELMELTLNEPIEGPTPKMLEESEALANAWKEFMVVWKLVGKK